MITNNDLLGCRSGWHFLTAIMYDMHCIDRQHMEIESILDVKPLEPSPEITQRYHQALEDYDKARALTNEECIKMMREQWEEAQSDIPNYINEISKINQKCAEIRTEIENWKPQTPRMKALKARALTALDGIEYSQKEIQNFESVLNRDLDDSPKAILQFKKKYIVRAFVRLNQYEDSYREAWQQYREREATVYEFLESFPAKQEETT